MSESWVNTVAICVLTALFSFTTAAYFFRKASQEVAERLMQAKIAELETKLAIVNQAVVPLNAAMQAMLIKELTHYHTPEMDELMRALGPPSTITEDERTRLTVLLEERSRDMGPLISDSERDAATILPIVIKRAQADAELLTGAAAMKLQLVTVAAVVGIPVVVVGDAR
jgi:uncharacterized protein YfkK (UPF0435 family)